MYGEVIWSYNLILTPDFIYFNADHEMEGKFVERNKN